MKVLGMEVSIKRSEPKTTWVACHHCGKDFLVGAKNIRAYNYCANC